MVLKKINETFFDSWTEESAYVFGYIFADGCISQTKGYYQVSIASKDIEMVEQIREVMQSEHAITITKEKEIAQFAFGTPKLIAKLQELGLKERKSTEGIVPENIPKEFIPHFIRGYFDGNGHFTYENHKPGKKRLVSGFTFGNEEMAKFIVDELKSFGLSETKIQHVHREREDWNSTYYQIKYYVRGTKKLYELMYNDATIYMQRKKEYFEEERS